MGWDSTRNGIWNILGLMLDANQVLSSFIYRPTFWLMNHILRRLSLYISKISSLTCLWFFFRLLCWPFLQNVLNPNVMVEQWLQCNLKCIPSKNKKVFLIFTWKTTTIWNQMMSSREHCHWNTRISKTYQEKWLRMLYQSQFFFKSQSSIQKLLFHFWTAWWSRWSSDALVYSK